MDIKKQAIQDLIATHDKTRLVKLREYYEGNHDILQRSFKDKTKPNNRLINDYPGEIVDTAVGYFIGIPIAYKSDDSSYLKEVNRIRIENNEELHNEALVTEMCVGGRAYELIYIDEEGEIRFIRIPFTEMITVNNGSRQEDIELAVRYYPVAINGDDATRVEVYDSEYITYYILAENELVLDDTEEVNPFPHYFKDVPVVEYKNNKQAQGDFEKVLTLIDEYNRHLSDVANEHEYFRNAYLMIKNMGGTDSEDIQEMREMGAFKVEGDGDVKFLIKEINDDATEHHFDRLDDNIHKFSKTPDLTDESFGGNLSGVAIKYKILELETKCITKERHMTAGLRRRWRLITNILNLKGNNFNYHDLRFEFRRNLPSNIQEESDIAQKLKGIVSDETLFGMMSFIEDPQAEIDRIREEREDDIAPSNYSFSEDVDGGE